MEERKEARFHLDRETEMSLERHLVTRRIRPHFHEYCELETVLSGTGRTVLNGEEFPLAPGTVYLLTPLDLHEVTPDGKVEVLNLSFRESLLREDLRLAWPAGGRGLLFSREEAGDLPGILLTALERETARSDPWADRAREDLLELLILHLTRLRPAPPRRENERRTENALRYLRQHFREPVTLAQAAAACGYSAPYFSRAFRADTGRTFVELLTELRIRWAKMRLATSDDSVALIGAESGFSSPGHFFRVFRAKTGATPRAWRQAQRQKKDG